MRRLMREHGLKEPLLEDLGGFFAVTFYGPGDRILNLIPEEGITDLRALGLNEQQIEALRLMVNEGQTMTARQYVQLFNVNRRTVQRDLGELVAKSQAKRIGQGAAIAYQGT